MSIEDDEEMRRFFAPKKGGARPAVKTFDDIPSHEPVPERTEREKVPVPVRGPVKPRREVIRRTFDE